MGDNYHYYHANLKDNRRWKSASSNEAAGHLSSDHREEWQAKDCNAFSAHLVSTTAVPESLEFATCHHSFNNQTNTGVRNQRHKSMFQLHEEYSYSEDVAPQTSVLEWYEDPVLHLDWS